MMTDKEKEDFVKVLGTQLHDLVINELKWNHMCDISKSKEEMDLLQKILLFNLPISLSSTIFGISENESLSDMYKLMLKNTK